MKHLAMPIDNAAEPSLSRKEVKRKESYPLELSFMIDSLKIRPAARAILIAIIKKNLPRLSISKLYEKIAQDCYISSQTVRRNIKYLVSLNLLIINRNMSAQYSVNLDRLLEMSKGDLL
jgi:hypothetical protein